MPSFYQLDFEQPVRELETRIDALERGAPQDSADLPAPALGGVEAPEPSETGELRSLRSERSKLLSDLYQQLSPWDTVRVARHPERPQSGDYITLMCREFTELHGDRRFGDDPAIITGFARLGAHKVLIVGHQKGRDTQEKLACHFGCAHPEGYRKALAKMKLAEKFGVPVVTLVDTPGAYPGLGAEERGQAEAIAVNLREMSRLKVPIVSVVIGEGGSGGALGIAVADRVAMLQHAWYSVISPEGCAAILWKQANEQTNVAAAGALRLTARDNLKVGIVDAVIAEPPGAAHRDPEAAAGALSDWIISQLDELLTQNTEDLLQARYDRFRRLGEFEESTETIPAPETPETP